MNILIAGAGGFIGTALTSRLAARGDEVVRLVRPGSVPSERSSAVIPWEPSRGKVSLEALDGFDAFVNLAGAGIAGRFTPARKEAIHNSRVTATGVLAHGMLRLKKRPRVYLSASAVGFYGNRGDDELTEHEWPGKDFLAEVCQAWEKAAQPAREFGVRVVHPRIGIVMDPSGGPLARLAPIFRLGLGGRLGNGRQYMSWISLTDAVNAILFALDNEQVEGPFNLSAPVPVTNAEFTRTLGAALHRPAFLHLPAPLLRLALGEMAELLLLSSIRAVPQKLIAAGYSFAHRELGELLAELYTPDRAASSNRERSSG